MELQTANKMISLEAVQGTLQQLSPEACAPALETPPPAPPPCLFCITPTLSCRYARRAAHSCRMAAAADGILNSSPSALALSPLQRAHVAAFIDGHDALGLAMLR